MMLDAAPKFALPAADRWPAAAAGPALLAGFAAALFASAFLVFSVQPVVSRMVLPRLGGSPAVWNTCVCFFQTALLLGYGYAHLATGRLRPRAQVALHGAVLAAGLALLPVSLQTDAPPAGASPVAWLLEELILGVGLPFVAIAATAPMLQVWFARTTHPHARDPYFLYGASNLGSLLALLGYPVLVETMLDLAGQVRLWSAGFAATAAAVLACGVAASFRAGPVAATAVAAATEPAGSVPLAERARWLALAFVPSALMLAATTQITTDIAAAPLLWVMPLAVYILTFVLAFARRPLLRRRALLLPQGVALAAAAAAGMTTAANTAALLAPLAAFALTAAVCHAELAEQRPAVRHLTGYFLLISVGGALGGMFNALVAPALFPVPLEYPLLLVAACLLRPSRSPAAAPARPGRDTLVNGLLLVALVALALLLVWSLRPSAPAGLRPLAHGAAGVATALALLRFVRNRTWFTVLLAGCLFAPVAADLSSAPVVERGFFGVHRVRLMPEEELVALQNGSTVHGVQGTRAGEELEPLAYYHRGGAFGRFFAALARRPEPVAAVGVLGLGTGVLGCYARPGEAWTFFEIDPAVERLARDRRWFRHMEGCGNAATVVLGDARLALAARDDRFDALVVDVFSSDSVPVHLLTREALSLYFSRLKPGGVVLFHVSNRHLELAPVVARLAAEAGAPARRLATPTADGASLRASGAEVVAVAAPGGDLDALAADGWDVPAPGRVLWTDGRSDLLGVVRWR